MINNRLIQILTEVRDIVDSPNTNVVWNGFESVDELLAEIDYCIKGVNNSEVSINERIRDLFAPTGPLQETSIDSGWSNRFIELSAIVDELI